MIHTRNKIILLAAVWLFVTGSAFAKGPQIISIKDLEERAKATKTEAEITIRSGTLQESASVEEAGFLPMSIVVNIKEELKQEALRGYIKKNDNADTSWFSQLPLTAYFGFEKKVSKIKPGLAFVPTDVSPIKFRGYRLLGAHSDGILTDNGWTGLIRVFRHNKSKKMLLLEENHYDRLMQDEYNDTFSPQARREKKRSPHVQVSERLNTEINGFPASLRSIESQDGASVTFLSWDYNGIQYHITVGGNAGKKLFKKSPSKELTSSKKLGTKFNLNDDRKIKKDPELEFVSIAKELVY